jgi:hypothetical protein
MSKKSKKAKVYKPEYYRFHWDWLKSKWFVHETKEYKVKWGLRTITVLGIAASFLIPVPILSGSIAILLACFQIFLEKSVIEYTSMIAQVPPNFKLELDQWINNAIGIPQQNGVPIAFGPAYKSEDYVYKIWRYIGSWNNNLRLDTEDNISVSIIIEENETYSTYIYSSPFKKSLAKQFELMAKEKGSSKLSQMRYYIGYIFGKNLHLVSGGQIDSFLKSYKEGQEYLFAPSVIDNSTGDAKILHHIGFVKHHLKVRRRHELTKADPEYELTPERTSQLED